MLYDDLVHSGDYICHHGIKGQKWGVRRYQNLDGSLTSAGRERYGYSVGADALPQYSSRKAPKDMINEAVKVNGGRKGYNYGYNRNENCAFCSVSYDARRRGIDVQAQQVLTGVSANKIDKYFSDVYSNYKSSMTKKDIAKRIGSAVDHGMSNKEYEDFTKDVLSEGKNTRGIMTIFWKKGRGGHAFNYEVRDGEFYIVDAQVGQVYSGKKARNYLSMGNNITRTRTDNLKIKEKNLRKKYSESYSEKKAMNTARKISKSLYNTAMLLHVPTMGFASIPLFLASAIVEKKANKLDEEYNLDLNTKWINEKRDNWY